MELTRVQFEIHVAEGQSADLDKKLKKHLKTLAPGTHKVFVELVPDNVLQAKKKYFAMVQELGIEAGYLILQDRNLFKEQVKQQLGNESISEMTTLLQISTKIEELHILAREHYNYKFKRDDY